MKMFDTMTPDIKNVLIKELYAEAKTPLIQRNHEQRVNDGEVEYFGDIDLYPQLKNYAVAICNSKTKIEIECGKDVFIINPGDIFLIDGNTRREFYMQRRHGVPKIDDMIETEYATVAVKYFSDSDTLEKYYGTFDSKDQLKKTKHVKQSAASLAGLKREPYFEVTNALKKVCKFKKDKDETEEQYLTRMMKHFGCDVIDKFCDLLDVYKSQTGFILPKSYGIGSWMIAYRSLRLKYSTRVSDVEKAMLRVWTYDFKDIIAEYEDNQKPGRKSPSRSSLLSLGILYCGFTYHEYLQPARLILQAKNGGDKIPVQSMTIYTLLSNYLNGNDAYSRLHDFDEARNMFASTLTV